MINKELLSFPPSRTNTTRFAQLSAQIRLRTTLSRRCWICLTTNIFLDNIWRWRLRTLKIKNRLPTVALQGQSPISLWQPEVLDPRRFPLQPYGTFVAAHNPLDTQNNRSGRSILSHYVGFSEDHRGETLVFNPKNRTTTVRHTYKALGLVEEQRLDDIIYVIDSPSPVTMTPVQTEQTQLIAPPITPMPTRSTTVASITSAAGAEIIPDSSILPRGILAAPSSPSAHILSPSNHFYLTLTVISATLRRVLSFVLREFTLSHQMTPYLSLLIVIGSTICTHTLRLHHVSTTMNTKPVTKFWQIPTTFLLLLFLQLTVAPTKFTPLRHVEFRTKQLLLDKRWHTLRR